MAFLNNSTNIFFKYEHLMHFWLYNSLHSCTISISQKQFKKNSLFVSVFLSKIRHISFLSGKN